MNTEAAKSHHHRLVQSSEVQSIIHGRHAIGRMNAWLAVKITTAVGSMWCAYAFMLLALVSLPSAIQSGNEVIIVAWISQTFLQLVLLSVIIVGQKVQGTASDMRAAGDHDTLNAIHTLSVAMLDLVEEQGARLKQLEDRQ